MKLKIKYEYIIILMLSFINALQIAFINNIYTKLFYFVFLSLLILINIKRIYLKSKTNFKIILFACLIFIIFIFSGLRSFNLITWVIFLVCYIDREDEWTRVISYILFPRIFVFIIAVIGSQFGIFVNYTIMRYSPGTLNILKVRYSLGFQHPNICYWFFFSIVMMYFYIHRTKSKLYEYLIFLLLSYVLFKFTDCRTGFYLLISTICMFMVNKYFNKIFNFIFSKKILSFSYLLMAIPGFLIPFLNSKNIENSVTDLFNKFLDTRMYWSSYAIKNFNISLFPRNLTMDNITIDNMYTYMPLQYGFLFFCIFIILTIITIRNLQKRRLYTEVLILFIFSIYFIAERVWLNVFVNPAIMFFTIALVKEKSNIYIR